MTSLIRWGRACLRKWGYRRCEDICWIKSNRTSGRNFHWLPDSVVTATSEHCLVGIKGTVRRNYDGHVIHANVDTDVMLSEEPAYGATDKPHELYAIIEHFCLGRRRLELFGHDTNIRRGWLTLGSQLSSSNFDPSTWYKHFEGVTESYNFDWSDEPELLSNHLLGTTPQIESLRPKSPTQLREEAERRHRKELEAAKMAQAQYEAESAAAAAEGREPPPPPQMVITPVPSSFREQSPFMAPGTNR
jgi:hypothetical protein